MTPDQITVIQQKIDRYERKLTTLRCSEIKEIRLQTGPVTCIIVCAELLQPSEIKRSYMVALKNRIIELKYELISGKNTRLTEPKTTICMECASVTADIICPKCGKLQIN